MWLIPLLFIGLVVWALSGNRRGAGYLGQMGHMAHGGPTGQEALEALKLRLAKGEITEEEYQRLKDLVK